MVNKYSKTNFYRSSDIDQMRVEREKLQRSQEEFEAYQAFMKICDHQPVPGNYRTKSGHHIRIMSNDSSWTRQEVSAEEQQLEFGWAWVPFPPVAQPGQPTPVQELYFGNTPMYHFVVPRRVGFSDLGEAKDQNGTPYRGYQFNKLVVVKHDLNKLDYEACPAAILDPSREHIRIYESGDVIVVPPIPEEFRCLLTPTQAQPAITQQIHEPAPIQVPEAQIWIDDESRSRSTPDSSFLSDNSNFTDGASQAPNNSTLTCFDDNNNNDAKVNDFGLGNADMGDLSFANFNFHNDDVGNWLPEIPLADKMEGFSQLS